MAKAKRVKGIECQSAPAMGIRLVLLTRFDEMYNLREAALDQTDPEGVHSMRVASRRLRSTLRDFTPYIRKQNLAPVLKQLRNVAGALGDVRDQDVAIAGLEKLAANAPEKVIGTVKQFIDTRKELRDQARGELELVLEESQLKKLKEDFVRSVDEAIASSKTQRTEPPAQITFLKMSRAIILDRLRELEKLSEDLFKPFEVESLHEMRIAAKRLRYALEVFQPCWPRSISAYAKRAARMQTALGDLHDCDVWIESVGKRIRDARRNKQDDEVVGLVWLLSQLLKLRTKHLMQAFNRWREWEAHNASSKLRATLAHGE